MTLCNPSRRRSALGARTLAEAHHAERAASASRHQGADPLRPKAGAVNDDYEGPIHNGNTPYLGSRIVLTTGTTSYLYAPACLTISRMARHLLERELFPRMTNWRP